MLRYGEKEIDKRLKECYNKYAILLAEASLLELRAKAFIKGRNLTTSTPLVGGIIDVDIYVRAGK